MSNIISSLNEVQREAAQNYNGATLIIAGAGSGKTRVLTHRIAYMLEQGVKPYNILALTFTNKAAKEMRERIAALVDPQVARSLWMGTFHSIFSRILRIEAAALGFTSNFTIYDTTDSKSVLRTIVREMGLDDKAYKDSTVYNRISYAKNNLIMPAAYTANAEMLSNDNECRIGRLHEVYGAYARRCKTADAMDFDDLLLFTNLLFRDFPDTLNKYAEKFKYILVDEYQDTNFAQYLIVKMLSKQHNNLCVVGDDAQSIYSFRGANIQNILNFQKDYPTCQTFKLEQNYRSTQNIVNAANSLIAKNKDQLHKTCFSAGSEGEKISVLQTMTDHEEGWRVVGDIEDRYYADRAQYSDFAILYRTNAQSRIFEDALRRKNIPYRIYAGTSFYQRKEIKDLLAYLRLIVNHKDDEAFKRIVNYPKRGIGNTTIERIEASAAEKGQSLWEAILGLTPEQADIKGAAYKKLSQFLLMIDQMCAEAEVKNAYDLANAVATKSGILEDLRSEKTMENISREENIEELLNSIKAFCDSYKEENGEEPHITHYLETVSLLTDADADSKESKNSITLMTVHSAKGLEFGYVYVVGLEDGLFPSQSIFTTMQNIEEERRLFYVALTRAKVKATLSFAQSRMRWGKVNTCIPSRFVNELDARYLDTAIDVPPPAVPNDDDDYSFVFRRQPTSGYSPTPTTTDYSAPQKTSGNNFKPLQRSVASGVASDTSQIQVGTRVMHERFGKGEVVAIESNGADSRATIRFAAAGTKTLLLKFAKLTVI
ncbi:DNA helicase [Bacteroidia bacterium]|nr:DNA helicase [Bacteroidia bacterium]